MRSQNSPTPASAPLQDQRVSILAVIVLYRITTEQCTSLQSLLRSQAEVGDHEIKLTTLLVDNSPTPPSLPQPLPPDVSILHCPENLGLANAYNQGILLAERLGCTWLLTLDQDTQLPETFLAGMTAHAREYQQDPSIAAILPRVQDRESPLSPLFYRWQALPTPFAKGYTGIAEEHVTGINSASMLRVDALRQAGGYDPFFWLDASDLVIFDRLYRLGKRAFVAGDVKVGHELSVKDMRHRLSPDRYRHMLLAESAFWDGAMGFLAGLERTARLALRLGRQIARREPAVLRNLTLRMLLRRIFRSPRYRRKLFLQDVAERIGTHLSSTALPARPLRVSICMASYNAGEYIDLQMESILPQLGPDDEVVVVDDHSTDQTPARIRAFADSRIRIIEHTSNSGVIKTFEHALRAATGDLLFLSDQDDIWASDKVKLFREAFARGLNIQLVTSAVSLVDANGVPFHDERFDRDGKFQRGVLRNTFKNGYQGSALAIRSSLLQSVLPFRSDRLYLHDLWIGTVNDRLGGGMVFLPEPLLLYRRHQTNASYTLGLWDQVLKRTQLLFDHLLHSFRSRAR